MPPRKSRQSQSAGGTSARASADTSASPLQGNRAGGAGSDPKSWNVRPSAGGSKRARTETGSDSDSDPPRPPPRRAVAPSRPVVIQHKAERENEDEEDDHDEDEEDEEDDEEIRVVAPRKPAKAKPTPIKKTAAKPTKGAPKEAKVPSPAPTPRTAPRRAAAVRSAQKAALSSGSGSDSDSEDSGSDAFVDSDNESAADSDDSVDSDDLDAAPTKRRASGGKPTAKQARTSTSGKTNGTAKKGKTVALSDEEIELEEGQMIIGRTYKEPQEGWVPPGQISRNTMSFLQHLMHDEYNDREWFKSREPWFRRAEKEFRDFVQLVQAKMAEQDTQVPVLPARDLCHRIYRDVRFSNDKSPYKTNFAFSTSRSGRKGPWAGYHMYVSPGDSCVLCGLWQPEKHQLERLRSRLLAPGGANQLKAAIGSKSFQKLFGPAEPHPEGKRQNIFGHPDSLKVAPKGVDKNHELIAFLKLRSFVVMKRFTNEETLAPDFAQKVADAVGIMAPFVHTLNDYIAPP